jgi:hypothetical protein
MADDVAQFTARMKKLEALACPSPCDVSFFNDHMQTAKSEGLTYREGLEYVIRMRNGGAD